MSDSPTEGGKATSKTEAEAEGREQKAGTSQEENHSECAQKEVKEIKNRRWNSE